MLPCVNRVRLFSRELRLTPSRFNCRVLANFSGVESKRPYRSAEKEIESRCLVFTFSTKREIWRLHVLR